MKKCSLRTKSAHLPTIQTAFEQFQRQNAVKNLSQGTIKFYSSKSRRFFCFLGDTEQRIDTITQETVEGYIIWMKDSQVRDTTINTNLRMVRAFLYWCMERRYIERFPIKLIRADQPIKDPYTADELERLLKERFRNAYIFQFSIHRVNFLDNRHDSTKTKKAIPPGQAA